MTGFLIECPKCSQPAIHLRGSVVSRSNRAAIAKFDRVGLEPPAQGLPAQSPQFLRQNPLALGFRALPFQLPSVVLPQFSFHPLRQPRFEFRPSQTPTPPYSFPFRSNSCRPLVVSSRIRYSPSRRS